MACLLVAASLSLVAIASGAFAADSLSAEQVVREVLAHNDRIAAARFMEQSASSETGPAGAWEDPMLMVGVANLPTSLDFGEDPMTMTMFGLSQRIPYAGEKGLLSRAAEARAQVAYLDRQAVEVDLARAARYAYADLYYRQQTLADLEAQTTLLYTVASAAEARLATHQTGQDEVLSAQASVWRLQARLLEVEHMADEARYDLNILRGKDAEADLLPLAAPEPFDIPETPDAWIATAQSRHPRLLRLRRQGEAYRLAGLAEGRMKWPMLELSAWYGIRADAASEPRDNMIGVQASFTLPVFGIGRQGSLASSMQSMHESQNATARQFARELEARLRVLHTTAIHFRDTRDLYRDRIIPTSQLAFESALSGYTAQRVPFTNLLLLASDVYRDRLALQQAGLELERTLADVRSLTEFPEAPGPEHGVAP